MYPGRRGREGACGAGRHCLNPNSRLGTSPHRGGWVMDVETTADRFVGIDVSKARVDVHVRPDGTAFGGATDPEGLGALVARLKPPSPCLVVLEAARSRAAVSRPGRRSTWLVWSPSSTTRRSSPSTAVCAMPATRPVSLSSPPCRSEEHTSELQSPCN